MHQRNSLDLYAHSVEGRPEEEWETLAKHLSEVAALAALHAKKIDAESWGRAAGLLHDVGKVSADFQRRLRGAANRVDHATAGARIATARFGTLGRLLAYAIGGHHAGLSNWGGGSGGGPSPLAFRLDPATYSIPACPEWEALCPGLPTRLSPFKPTSLANFGDSSSLRREGLSLALFTRMLFSALVDADRLATETFYRRVEGKEQAPRGAWPPLAVLKANLDAHTDALMARTSKQQMSPGQQGVMAERAAILAAARRAASQPPGLYSLTVPTGGGKTLASLAFALDHAVAHGLDRIIYVIPFTSIIEQTARVFREALGPELAHCVIEHHSAFREDEALERMERAAGGESALQQGERLWFATENWDAPIIVTTAVQFFESLFSNRPGRCRKLHNIARSVVILDEAQMLPTNLLRPTVAAIEELTLKYHACFVLCTATQPAVTAEGRDGKGGLKGGLGKVREIVADTDALYEKLRRVTVAPCRKLTPDELATALSEADQVLCIVGTRRQARVLFTSLLKFDATAPVFHLSALMCAEHRTQQLHKIKQALGEGWCRVIATTVIEAGVDIDFPVVWRQMAGLDSIAQAAGRCNREGRRAKEGAVVQPFEVEDWSTIRELRVNEAAAREVLRHLSAGQDPLGPAAIGAYFDRLYRMRAQGQVDGLDAKGILPMLNGLAHEGCLPFADVAAAYRLIESAMEPVIVPFDARARAAIGELADPALDRIRDVARRLQPYIVNVPRGPFAALKQAGRIAPINPYRFDEQFMRLTDEAYASLYSNALGFDWSDETFRSVESLMW